MPALWSGPRRHKNWPADPADPAARGPAAERRPEKTSRQLDGPGRVLARLDQVQVRVPAVRIGLRPIRKRGQPVPALAGLASAGLAECRSRRRRPSRSRPCSDQPASRGRLDPRPGPRRTRSGRARHSHGWPPLREQAGRLLPHQRRPDQAQTHRRRPDQRWSDRRWSDRRWSDRRRSDRRQAGPAAAAPAAPAARPGSGCPARALAPAAEQGSPARASVPRRRPVPAPRPRRGPWRPERVADQPGCVGQQALPLAVSLVLGCGRQLIGEAAGQCLGGRPLTDGSPGLGGDLEDVPEPRVAAGRCLAEVDVHRVKGLQRPAPPRPRPALSRQRYRSR